jgi:hypothetical protein
VEPATGQRAARATWKSRHDNAFSVSRPCKLDSGSLRCLLAGRMPRHLTVAKESAVASTGRRPKPGRRELACVRDWTPKGAVRRPCKRLTAPTTRCRAWKKSTGELLSSMRGVESGRQSQSGPVARCRAVRRIRQELVGNDEGIAGSRVDNGVPESDGTFFFGRGRW